MTTFLVIIAIVFFLYLVTKSMQQAEIDKAYQTRMAEQKVAAEEGRASVAKGLAGDGPIIGWYDDENGRRVYTLPYFQYIDSPAGKALIQQHGLYTQGRWHIYGEFVEGSAQSYNFPRDTQYDYTPDLGTAEGSLGEAIVYATNLPQFWNAANGKYAKGGKIYKSSSSPHVDLTTS
jgi:hypothetical protein